MKHKTNIAKPQGFTEYTFSNGECEFMAHEANGKWVRVYVYTRDIATHGESLTNWGPRIRETKPSVNPLFMDVVKPLPATFIRSAAQYGFVCCEDDEKGV